VSANRIVRTLCVFSREASAGDLTRLRVLSARLEEAGFSLQTVRICSPGADPQALEAAVPRPDVMLSLGTLSFDLLPDFFPRFLRTDRVAFNIDLTHADIGESQVRVLLDMISHRPENTFRFAYVFCHVPSSPFFPSARYERDGFVLGLQATDLSAGCSSVGQWLERMRGTWLELEAVFEDEPDFLGIDSSIAPLFEGDSSLLHFLHRLGYSLEESVTSDLFLRMTAFVKEQNPRPIGLCGLMLPCLEDFELAREYERGAFTVERNLFASLQSGLGIDTYPLGIDERPERVAQLLRLVQGLARKFDKPLSVRLVSDGKARIGERTDFGNRYLKDVIVRPL
jgi:uncharacterized protein